MVKLIVVVKSHVQHALLPVNPVLSTARAKHAISAFVFYTSHGKLITAGATGEVDCRDFWLEYVKLFLIFH